MKLGSQRFGTFKFPSDYDVERTATLNKTDLTGGNNKYYQLEAHVSKDKKKYRLYSRYGRVGHEGTEEERIPEQDEVSLLSAFDSLLREKTSAKKGYVEVKMAATKMGSSINNARILSDDIRKDKVVTDKKDAGSKQNLPREVENLVSRLYAEAGKAVRNQLSGALKTTAENPLGTLTLTQIDEGKKWLREVQDLLTAKPKLKNTIHADVLALSNKFYSSIPQTIAHRPKSAEGQKAMDEWLMTMALNNETILDEKEELLDLLSDVQGMVGGFNSTDSYKKFSEIGCAYDLLPDTDESYKKIHKYVTANRSRHHNWGIEIERVWRVGIKGQKDKHLPTMQDIGNVQPLFHGSRPANILGICKHGLLLRPPGAYVTGSMFGNGLYFADQSSKSEQYATARFGGGGGSHGDTFFMFVADVALGKIKKYQDAQTHLQKAPSGYHSVQGEKGSYLLHNEFIIYDVKQHILHYLVEFKTR